MQVYNASRKQEVIIRFGIYLLLFPLFFVLHGYNENFGVISWWYVLELFLKYSLIACALLFFGAMIIKNATKAFVFAFVCLCFYFFFGSVHDFLKLNLKNQRLVSYSVLIPSIFILVILTMILLKRSKEKYKRLAYYIKVLLIAFVLIEAVNLMFKAFLNKPQVGSTAAIPAINKKKLRSSDKQPDIFFVVFDGYTSSSCLKEEFGFDNSTLDSLLKAHDFFVSYSSKSNYNLTPFSLGSILNTSYLKVEHQEYIMTQKDLLSAVNTVKNNWIIPFFQMQGYVIKNFGVFDFKTAPVETYPYFGKDYFIGAIDDQTLFSRALHDIGWNFIMKNIFTGSFRVPKSYIIEKKKFIDRNWVNYNQLLKALQTDANSPRFVYCHIMLPHDPYYFKADGSLTSDTAILLRNLDEKVAYINQIQYSNKLLEKIIRLSSENSNRKRIVIIMGDHGYRSYPSKKDRPKTFRNLNCIYTSDQAQELYDGISPVNTFRFVLNKYFGQSLPLLRDSSIYLVDPKYDTR